MQITVLSIGKIKNKQLLHEIEELSKRIPRLKRIELKEIKASNEEQTKRKEFEEIGKYLDNEYYKVLLSERWKVFTTDLLYHFLRKIDRPLLFIISGAYGPSIELIDSVDIVLSLSPLTFTHEMAYYLLIEQLYRLETIEKGIPYNK